MSAETEKLEALMKECQRGVAGKGPAIEAANNLLAECYGALGKLLAEHEALRKDAERYRWLRDPDGQEDLGSEYNMPPIICGYAEHEDILTMDALDRAIDTGIEELKK